jgi:hypothetical protein
MTWAAPLLTAETAVFVLVGFSGFRSQGYSLAEAAAAAIVSMFVLVSLIQQIVLLSGRPLIGGLIEVTILAALLCLFRKHPPWPKLIMGFKMVRSLLGQETSSVGLLMGTWGTMAALVVAGWFGLAGPPIHSLDLAVIDAYRVPLNGEALFRHCSRLGLGPGACGFGLLAHLAVGLSTYALARRYAWPPLALTVTLVVVSMPRLVVLGVRPTTELIATAAVAVAMVMLHRLLEQHRAVDLALFLVCTAFSIHNHPMSLGLAALLVLLLLVVMVRRHGWIIWGEMLSERFRWGGLILLVVLALAQVPVFTLNLAQGYPLFGTSVLFEEHGLLGAAINLVRYLLISIDPTEVVRWGIHYLTDMDLAHLMARIDAMIAAPLAAHSGAGAAFTPIFTGGRDLGFGPLLPLLVLLATVHAFLRGPRRLKAVSLAWAGYLYISALVLAWQPDNIGVLTPLFAANGFLVAFSLPPYRLRRRGMRLLHSLSILLLLLSFYLAL